MSAVEFPKTTVRSKTALHLPLLMALAVIAVGLNHGLVRAATPVSLTLKGAWPAFPRGPARDVAVPDQYAYVAAGRGGLIVFDLSDPANLIPISGAHSGYSADETRHHYESIAASGDYAYLAGNYCRLQVIDISDPRKPIRLGSHDGE